MNNIKYSIGNSVDKGFKIEEKENETMKVKKETLGNYKMAVEIARQSIRHIEEMVSEVSMFVIDQTESENFLKIRKAALELLEEDLKKEEERYNIQLAEAQEARERRLSYEKGKQLTFLQSGAGYITYQSAPVTVAYDSRPFNMVDEKIYITSTADDSTPVKSNTALKHKP